MEGNSTGHGRFAVSVKMFTYTDSEPDDEPFNQRRTTNYCLSANYCSSSCRKHNLPGTVSEK